jgi:hypothetical protein
MKIEWGDQGPEGATRFTNIMHAMWGTKPAIDTALANTLFTMITNAFASSNLSTFVHPTTFLKRLQIKDISVVNMPWHLSTAAEVAGAGLLDPITAQSAIAVTSLTQFAGKQWHGRFYVGGLDAAAQLDSRHHGTAAGAAAVAFGEAIRTGVGASQLTLALAQRALQAGSTSQGAPLPARAAHAEPITGHKITNNRFDTQRRRLGR